MLKNKIAVITIHKGRYKELFKTIKSINNQISEPDIHILVISKIGYQHSKVFEKKNRKIIINRDKSLYDAMNIALNFSFDYNVVFINSGDEFSSKYSIKRIKANLSLNKCLVFKTKIIGNQNIYYPKKSFFLSEIYKPHPSFIRPPIKKNINKILFNEKNNITADAEWMEKNLRIFKLKKIDCYTSNFYLGGTTTVPTLKSITQRLKYGIIDSFKELIKFFIFNIFNKKDFYKIIFSKNFYYKK